VLKASSVLFSGVVKAWIRNTHKSHALPMGTHALSVTGLATLCYAAPIHLDIAESLWTIGIRTGRSTSEPPMAYQFVYTDLSGDKTKRMVVIVMQPKGTMQMWAAPRHRHASSIDSNRHGRENRWEMRKDASKGVILTQKKAMLTLSANNTLATQTAARVDLMKPKMKERKARLEVS